MNTNRTSGDLYVGFVKPFIDRVVAFIALVLLSPIILVCLVLLAIVNNGRVWFVQRRPGKDEKIFSVIKFRTMNDQRDDDGNLLPDEMRLTAIGKLIRKTSLDEIPQLINVLMGDMSLIGPRPLLIDYLPLYNEQEKKRHQVKPGITGWAQVHGRNAISWQVKFEYDCWYVDHISFLIDMKVLFLTVIKVLQHQGISSSTSSTMERFKGSV